jgi:tRNA-splicing ligase RtcB
MKTKDVLLLGIPHAAVSMEAAKNLYRELRGQGLGDTVARRRIGEVASAPEDWLDDVQRGGLARAINLANDAMNSWTEREIKAPAKVWGSDPDPKALDQLENARRLPIAVAGALMPDAHMGYGLPIGGVLAVQDAVIPYAVGVDIACRMHMSVLDIPNSMLEESQDFLAEALEHKTKFGVGGEYRGSRRKQHPVMDEDWNFSPVVEGLKARAANQLGTSGSGNHFAEFGLLTLDEPDLGLAEGAYLALLTHSGSRGTGGLIAEYFSGLAMRMHPELPRELMHLAWFDLGSHEGQEYMAAMRLMGRYARANHQLIHEGVLEHLGAKVLAVVENHHNFAWVEDHFGQEVVVHRKGATPAHAGALAVVPGTMATPGFVVRGRGVRESLSSSAHGAGRKMSRTKATEAFTWANARELLDQAGVKLLSAGLDEIPLAYKDIESVMADQRDLVDVVARFDPRIVKMAPAGERPED